MTGDADCDKCVGTNFRANWEEQSSIAAAALRHSRDMGTYAALRDPAAVRMRGMSASCTIGGQKCEASSSGARSNGVVRGDLKQDTFAIGNFMQNPDGSAGVTRTGRGAYDHPFFSQKQRRSWF